MTYILTPEQANAISDVDIAFGTIRLLPLWNDIPAEFHTGNRYTQLAADLFSGRPVGDSQIEIHEGFTPALLDRAVKAHLVSAAPSHEHKIAGVGLMISRMCTFVEEASSQ